MASAAAGAWPPLFVYRISGSSPWCLAFPAEQKPVSYAMPHLSATPDLLPIANFRWQFLFPWQNSCDKTQEKEWNSNPYWTCATLVKKQQQQQQQTDGFVLLKVRKKNRSWLIELSIKFVSSSTHTLTLPLYIDQPSVRQLNGMNLWDHSHSPPHGSHGRSSNSGPVTRAASDAWPSRRSSTSKFDCSRRQAAWLSGETRWESGLRKSDVYHVNSLQMTSRD